MSIPFFNIGKSPKKNKIIIFAKQAIPCSMVAGIVIGGLAILGKRIEAKDCYRFYTDIRRRKNYSRTYFLDKMQEKLNEKMRRDDELEGMRR